MGRCRAISLSVCLTIAVVAIVLAGGAGRTAARVPDPDPAVAGPSMSRVISVRVHHTRISTVRNTNARRIGRSIAGLNPTWVSGTLRYARNQYPKRREMRTWHQIRRIDRRDGDAADFDIVLNALQYRTPAAITKTMRRLRAKLGNEGWFFDFLSQGFRKHPKMIRAAVASAHRHGEWIGGNIFGLKHRRALPARVDFYAVQDPTFQLNLRAVRRISRRKPVMYHLHNDPVKQHLAGCRFIERFSSYRRKKLIRQRAAEQDRGGFRVSYPVYFPECLRARPRGPGSFLYSYNAFRDPPVAREIRRLLDIYDYGSGT